MRLAAPIIVKALRLAEYAPEFGEAEILVWANPPVAMLDRYRELVAEILEAGESVRLFTEKVAGMERADRAKADEGSEEIRGGLARIKAAEASLRAWMVEVWSQGPEATRWTVGELDRMIEETRDTDPGLWSWLTTETLGLIREHRAHQKKAWTPPSSR